MNQKHLMFILLILFPALGFAALRDTTPRSLLNDLAFSGFTAQIMAVAHSSENLLCRVRISNTGSLEFRIGKTTADVQSSVQPSLSIDLSQMQRIQKQDLPVPAGVYGFSTYYEMTTATDEKIGLLSAAADGILRVTILKNAAEQVACSSIPQ